jgi:hypothetical protein
VCAVRRTKASSAADAATASSRSGSAVGASQRAPDWPVAVARRVQDDAVVAPTAPSLARGERRCVVDDPADWERVQARQLGVAAGPGDGRPDPSTWVTPRAVPGQGQGGRARRREEVQDGRLVVVADGVAEPRPEREMLRGTARPGRPRSGAAPVSGRRRGPSTAPGRRRSSLFRDRSGDRQQPSPRADPSLGPVAPGRVGPRPRDPKRSSRAAVAAVEELVIGGPCVRGSRHRMHHRRRNRDRGGSVPTPMKRVRGFLAVAALATSLALIVACTPGSGGATPGHRRPRALRRRPWLRRPVPAAASPATEPASELGGGHHAGCSEAAGPPSRRE